MLSPSAFAAETSFDCSKATHQIEKLVCGDDQLAGLDRTLADDFKKAMGQISAEDQKDLRAAQAAWINTRNACAKDERSQGLRAPKLQDPHRRDGRQIWLRADRDWHFRFRLQ